jgi:hypothetical protein
MVSTSTIISTIMSVIAAVGVRTVYISSRRKKCSTRLKISIIFSWLALASLAAWWEPRCQNGLRKRHMEDTDQEENADPRKDCICRWECLKVYVKTENSPRQNISIRTSPIPWPTVAENAYNTLTVGETHFVSLSSPFWDWLNAAGICS